jgi:hypothetical protein
MRNFIAIVVALLLSTAACRANRDEAFPFQVGEKLTYQIYWGPFAAGEASLEVQGIDPVDGHDCYHLIAKAKTTGFIDLLFHIDSTNESWMDKKELFTRRFLQNHVEGKRVTNGETRFDYAHNQYTLTNHIDGTQQIFPLKQPLQDILSAMYYVRTQPLTSETPQNFLVNSGDTNRLVNIIPSGYKTIRIRPLGEVLAMRIEPKPTLPIVTRNKGRMWIWVSDDAQKLPLLVVTSLKIGSARLVLEKIEPTNPVPPVRLRTNIASTTKE